MSRYWVQQLVKRFEAEGGPDYQSRSRRPHHSPHAVTGEVEDQIIRLRKELPKRLAPNAPALPTLPDWMSMRTPPNPAANDTMSTTPAAAAVSADGIRWRWTGRARPQLAPASTSRQRAGVRRRRQGAEKHEQRFDERHSGASAGGACGSVLIGSGLVGSGAAALA